MRARLLTILLLLVAGAVVNVGVAWGYAVTINASGALKESGHAVRTDSS